MLVLGLWGCTTKPLALGLRQCLPHTTSWQPPFSWDPANPQQPPPPRRPAAHSSGPALQQRRTGPSRGGAWRSGAGRGGAAGKGRAEQCRARDPCRKFPGHLRRPRRELGCKNVAHLSARYSLSMSSVSYHKSITRMQCSQKVIRE